MLRVVYSTSVNTDSGSLWGFISDFRKWAPFVMGFEDLEIVDEHRSIWTLRGDAGILSREVEFEVQIDVWDPEERVEFTLHGLTEVMDGRGVFMMAATPALDAPDVTVNAQQSNDRVGFIRRWVYRVLSRVLVRSNQRPKPRSPAALVAAREGPVSSFEFKLELAVGGTMAPMIETLMDPLLLPAAEDVVERIRNALEIERQAAK